MEATLQHLFKKNNLHDVPVEKLQEMTKEFPYFSVGQFLQTLKLKELGDPSFDDQFQKNLVYFNNPLWLQYKVDEFAKGTKAVSPVVPAELRQNIPAPPTTSLDDEEGSLSHDLVEAVVLHQENDFTDEAAVEQEPVLPEKIPAETKNSDTETEKQTIQRDEPFTFQAYYTVDYFASQGIKLNLDSQQQDKLGKQLKSFTEWLKTMRRLPETSVVEILDKIKEGEIAQIAAHSLEENKVMTEAMAEVLLKQGQHEKAREVYRKLSLQNPHKSTYFAAKIEDLKLI